MKISEDQIILMYSPRMKEHLLTLDFEKVEDTILKHRLILTAEDAEEPPTGKVNINGHVFDWINVNMTDFLVRVNDVYMSIDSDPSDLFPQYYRDPNFKYKKP